MQQNVYHQVRNLLIVILIVSCYIGTITNSVWAQDQGNLIYLPVIANGQRPDGPPGIIQQAGRLPSENDEGHHKPIGDKTVLPPVPGSDPVKTIRCSTQDWTSQEVRNLQDTITLNANSGIIYPGALIQGKDLEAGYFTPITIPRAGGTIHLKGLTLSPDANYSETLAEITGAGVNQSIQDILSAGVDGTAARASYSLHKVYSFEQALFEFGLDARYGPVSLKSALKIDQTKKRNKILLKFTQTYYDVIFTDPETSTSVFRDGDKFRDPEGQIASGNPPLYVSKVSYGRMIFFLVESEFDAEDVMASLDAAYNGLGANVEVRAGLTRKEIMSKTNIYYHVIGGDAGLALKPIDTVSPEQMYAAVKNFIADKEAARFSASNPGVPIAYTLRYLSTRDVARMSYSVTYGHQDCEAVLKALADVTVTFDTVHIIDDADHPGWAKGKGDIRLRFKVNGEEYWYPGPEEYSGYKEMDSDSWHPIEISVPISLQEDDSLMISVEGFDDEGNRAVVSDDDYLGAVQDKYLYTPSRWGSRSHCGNQALCTFSVERISSRADGQFEIFYTVNVKWIRDSDDPNVKLNNQSTDRCLNIHSGQHDFEGGPVTSYTCADTTDQEWELMWLPNGNVKLKNQSTDRCLNIHTGQYDFEGGPVTSYMCADTTDQEWELMWLPNGNVKLKNQSTDRCLNIHAGQHDFEGGPVTSYTCADTTDQEWILFEVSAAL